MEIAYIISFSIVLITLIYTVFIKPILEERGYLTREQLELIDFACEKGVSFAEQIYKHDPSIDRYQLAIDYAFEVIEKAGIIPDMYLTVIQGMIEDYVRKLPKTHDADGNIVV